MYFYIYVTRDLIFTRDKKFGFISALKRLFALFWLHVGFDSHRSQQTIHLLTFNLLIDA